MSSLPEKTDTRRRKGLSHRAVVLGNKNLPLDTRFFYACLLAYRDSADSSPDARTLNELHGLTLTFLKNAGFNTGDTGIEAKQKIETAIDAGKLNRIQNKQMRSAIHEGAKMLFLPGSGYIN